MEKNYKQGQDPEQGTETGIFRDKGTVKHSGKGIFREKCQKWNPNQESSGEKSQYQEPGTGILRGKGPNKDADKGIYENKLKITKPGTGTFDVLD